MSWDEAGAFVWHESDVSPEVLGQELRHNGFGWVAVFLHDGLTADPVEDDWVARLRRASGLLVGGWGALRTQPVEEAALASSLVTRYGLDFYIADAEAEYGYSGTGAPDKERFRRSQKFVASFRELQPLLPCRLVLLLSPGSARHRLERMELRGPCGRSLTLSVSCVSASVGGPVRLRYRQRAHSARRR